MTTKTTITTKHHAEKIRRALTAQGTEFQQIRFDLGKYKRDLQGRDVATDAFCVWSEPRRDQDGAFWILNCLTR
jgi:hypothetical protein